MEPDIRRSLKTGSWERATDLGRVIEDAEDPGCHPRAKRRAGHRRPGRDRIPCRRQGTRTERGDDLTSLTSSSASNSWHGAKQKGYRLLREIDLRAVHAFRASLEGRGDGQEEKTGAFNRLLLVLHPSRLDRD
jgi:hypothetical protein